MIYDYIYFYASKYLPWPFSLLASLVAMLIALLLIIAVVPIFIGWVDRKFSARVESRWGPVYVGPFGLLQNFADVIKLMGKRFITSKGDWFSYNFAPLALGVASFLMIAIIPWGLPSLAFIDIPYNLLGLPYTHLGIISMNNARVVFIQNQAKGGIMAGPSQPPRNM